MPEKGHCDSVMFLLHLFFHLLAFSIHTSNSKCGGYKKWSLGGTRSKKFTTKPFRMKWIKKYLQHCNIFSLALPPNRKCEFYLRIKKIFPLFSVVFIIWINFLYTLLCKDNTVQFRSVAQSCLTLCDPMNRSTPGLTVLHCLQEFALIHVHWVGDAIYLILCCPLLLLPSIFPSIRVFSNESALCTR